MWYVVFDGGTRQVGAGETFEVSSFPLLSLGKTREGNRVRVGRREVRRGSNSPSPCTYPTPSGIGEMTCCTARCTSEKVRHQGIFGLLFRVHAPPQEAETMHSALLDV